MVRNFHVMFKSYDDKPIFHGEKDYLIYLQLVRRACEKYEMSWLAYALMSNHIHLVVRGEQSALPHFRYNISSGYAAYYRRTYPCSGKPVFRRHNTTKWLQAKNDLKQVIRYVHRNLIEKGMEVSLGDSPRTSYSAVLAARMPSDFKNPFNQYDELREIRDALDVDAVFRAFGKNHSEQLQNFIAFHQLSAPELPWVLEAKGQKNAKDQLTEDLQRAEMVLKQYFSRRYSFLQKEYNGKNRQVFLGWLGKRGNPMKVELVLRLAAETRLSSRQIAEFLQLGRSTVQNIINESKS